MKRHYISDKVLIRDVMKIGTIDKIIDGDLTPVIEPLIREHHADQLAGE